MGRPMRITAPSEIASLDLLLATTAGECRALTEPLSAAGHRLYTAAPAELWGLLAYYRFAALLIDADSLDGPALIAELRRGAACTVPILALVAEDALGRRAQLVGAGADDLIEKRMLPTRLLHAVAEARTPLDARELRALTGHDRGLLRQVVALFRRDAPGQLEALRAALGSGQAGAIGAAAHELKSSCFLIAAHPAAQMARHIEHAAATEPAARLTAHFATLERLLARLQAELAATMPDATPGHPGSDS